MAAAAAKAHGSAWRIMAAKAHGSESSAAYLSGAIERRFSLASLNTINENACGGTLAAALPENMPAAAAMRSARRARCSLRWLRQRRKLCLAASGTAAKTGGGAVAAGLTALAAVRFGVSSGWYDAWYCACCTRCCIHTLYYRCRHVEPAHAPFTCGYSTCWPVAGFRVMQYGRRDAGDGYRADLRTPLARRKRLSIAERRLLVHHRTLGDAARTWSVVRLVRCVMITLPGSATCRNA